MSFPALVSTFSSEFATRWWADYPLAPVYFDNNPLVDALGNPLDDEDGKPTPDPEDPYGTMYATQVVVPGVPLTITLGGTDWTNGATLYRVFIAKRAGHLAGPTVAESIRGYFRGRKAAGVTFIGPGKQGPSWRPADTSENGRALYEVLVPFQYVETGLAAEPDSPADLDGSISGGLRVSQVGHGFARGQAVAFNLATDAWELLQATLAKVANYGLNGQPAAHGLVAQVIDADTFRVVLSGAVKIVAHGLPEGQLLFYSDSVAGDLTATTPAPGSISWLAGVATSSDFFVHSGAEWKEL